MILFLRSSMVLGESGVVSIFSSRAGKVRPHDEFRNQNVRSEETSYYYSTPSGSEIALKGSESISSILNSFQVEQRTFPTLEHYGMARLR